MSGKSLRRALSLWVSAALLASLTAATMATPATAAPPTDCRVKNLDKGSVRPTLHKAVKWADAGDRLTVRGTCHGITTIDKDLTITGIRRDGSGRPTLDGDRKGSVLTIKPGAKVSLRDLKIVDGWAKYGGGVYNGGTLRLFGATVIRSNEAVYGGGVSNWGTLVVWGASSIRNNTAQTRGGGIINLDGAVKLYGKSSIRGNEARDNAGGIDNKGAVKLYNKSSIRGNGSGYHGGGVANEGTLVLWGASSIHENSAASRGGGVWNDAGTIKLNSASSIHHNTASSGGGVYWDGGQLLGADPGVNVYANSPDDIYPIFW